MSLTPGKKLFHVTIERTITGYSDLYIEGDSEEEVRNAVEEDDLDGNYEYDDDIDFSIQVIPIPLDKLPQTERIAHGVLAGTVYEIDSDEYQNALKSDGCYPDMLTLPLFPDEEKK